MLKHRAVGPGVGIGEGAPVGGSVGAELGGLVGSEVGCLVGVPVGALVGNPVGALVGDSLGGCDGARVGRLDGGAVGVPEGRGEGAEVGAPVMNSRSGEKIVFQDFGVETTAKNKHRSRPMSRGHAIGVVRGCKARAAGQWDGGGRQTIPLGGSMCRQTWNFLYKAI